MTFTYSAATGVLAWMIFVAAVAMMCVLMEGPGRMRDGDRLTAKVVIAWAAHLVLLFGLILSAVHGIACMIGEAGHGS